MNNYLYILTIIFFFDKNSLLINIVMIIYRFSEKKNYLNICFMTLI